MKIYAGNLSWDVTEEELREVFEAHGAVASVNIVTDRETGRSRGFAFVEMAVKAEADAAIEALNGHEFMGRTLNVNEARPREERPARSGGFGGGDRSGGGGSRSGGFGGGSRSGGFGGGDRSGGSSGGFGGGPKRSGGSSGFGGSSRSGGSSDRGGRSSGGSSGSGSRW